MADSRSDRDARDEHFLFDSRFGRIDDALGDRLNEPARVWSCPWMVSTLGQNSVCATN